MPRRAAARPSARRPAEPRRPAILARRGHAQDGTRTSGPRSVVIAAITSCTNTSNPAVLLGAALLAKKAVERGLARKPWVKTSLAPGSKVVMDYLRSAGLLPYLEALGFHLVGYGCTTCIGNSGPLPDHIAAAVTEGDLVVGGGAFREPELRGPDQPLRPDELPGQPTAGGGLRHRRGDGRRPRHRAAGGGPERQSGLPQGDLARRRRMPRGHRCPREAGAVPTRSTPTRSRATPGGRPCRCPGDTFAWDAKTHLRPAAAVLREPPEGAAPVTDIHGARVLALLGDSVTTDHISPAGAINADSPAARYLMEHGVEPTRLQLLRLAARQPRGDDPRHVRQHPAAQPAGPRHRGRGDGEAAGATSR